MALKLKKTNCFLSVVFTDFTDGYFHKAAGLSQWQAFNMASEWQKMTAHMHARAQTHSADGIMEN